MARRIVLRLSALAVLLIGAVGCAAKIPAEPDLQSSFADVLDVHAIPTQADDLSAFSFLDHGAWHGFGLPPRSKEQFFAGFTGPFLLTHRGRWLSQGLVRLSLFDVEAQRPIDLVWREGQLNSRLPGRLSQRIEAEGLEVKLDLVFATHRSSLIRAEVTNLLSTPRSIRLEWNGNLFMPEATLEADSGELRVGFQDSTARVVVTSSRRAPIEIGGDGRSYRLVGSAKERLEKGASNLSLLTVSAFFDPEEQESERREISRILESPEAVFEENRRRWNGYLQAVLGQEPQESWSDRQRVIVKAVETLIGNWRGPAGDLLHNGLFPSYAYRGFHGVWSWDSWKHAVALARFAPDLAKDQLRVMFDYQNSAGMVADVIYRDQSENNWRDTKPPLASWAVWSIYLRTREPSFLQEMYPKLMHYHRWWYADRDHDRNGLCEYGSTDGTRIAAAWESGMDNAVRFDDAAMVQNGPSAWSLNQESVDLNSYLYAEKGYLASISEVLGIHDESARLREEAQALRTMIQTRMFDGESGYFYDIWLEDKQPIRVQGPEGWIPLWTGVATPEQAERVRRILVDPSKFATTVPFPTLAADHPEFNPLKGYWRGPVWLDQAYFAIQGLRRYGFEREADLFTQRLLQHAQGLLASGSPIHENYHPVSGEALNAPHFSWSAAHVLLLATDQHEAP